MLETFRTFGPSDFGVHGTRADPPNASAATCLGASFMNWYSNLTTSVTPLAVKVNQPVLPTLPCSAPSLGYSGEDTAGGLSGRTRSTVISQNPVKAL